MPAYIGEAVAFSNGKIISHGGVLPSSRHQLEAENELRIYNTSK